jgi:MoxR-like ATPase
MGFWVGFGSTDFLARVIAITYSPKQTANMTDSNESGAPMDPMEGSSTVSEVRAFFEQVSGEVGKVFVGQEELVTTALVALVSGGHVLIEGVPGLGKTLFVKTLGRVIGCQFGRIQFTADLMPSDVTGAPIFDMKTQDFRFRPGPVFTQLLLADEINRSPAKTHAALLEIMQESRVTIDGVTHSVPLPFLVFATQNPLESEGTYSLPEAQLDRFMFKATVGYPSEEEETRVLEMHSRKVDMDRYLATEIRNVTSAEAIYGLIQKVSEIRIEPKLLQYINKIVRTTRAWPTFHLGASPRAGLSLVQGARALAAFRGRNYAVPDDVSEIVLPALRHRVVLGAEAEVDGTSIDQELRTLLKSVEVPRM